MNTREPEWWSLDPQARGLRIELPYYEMVGTQTCGSSLFLVRLLSEPHFHRTVVAALLCEDNAEVQVLDAYFPLVFQLFLNPDLLLFCLHLTTKEILECCRSVLLRQKCECAPND